MSVTRNKSRVGRISEDVLSGDLRTLIEEKAGTSMKDTSKKFQTTDDLQDKCHTAIPKLFKTGCIPHHPSIDTPQEENADPGATAEADILLLQECLNRVKNDTRCVGSPYYKGIMVENYWPKNVEIEEDDLVNSIRKLIPTGDLYSRLLDKSQTECLVLTMFWKQHLLGRPCQMSLRFDITPQENSSELKLNAEYENDDGDDEYNTLVDTEIGIEDFLQIVGHMCTQPWYDLVDDNIRINETDYESIRLRGKHNGQKIYMYELINTEFEIKRTLLNVKRM